MNQETTRHAISAIDTASAVFGYVLVTEVIKAIEAGGTIDWKHLLLTSASLSLIVVLRFLQKYLREKLGNMESPIAQRLAGYFISKKTNAQTDNHNK